MKWPRIWLFFFLGFCYAAFFCHGLPLWDDDFTSWLSKAENRNFGALLWEWVSPLSTQAESWGFSERPLEALFYKFCYSLSGYNSWSYFLIKDLFYGGLGVMIYLWGLRVSGPSGGAKWPAAMASLVFLSAPSPMASQVMLSDFAPVAEFLFLALTYIFWQEIERFPEIWQKWDDVPTSERAKWVKRWSILTLVTYLAYKSKADIKLIPLILTLYLVFLRRSSKFIYIPIGIMALLAIPWGSGVFSHLPPFLPGSHGSRVAWMWQPASLHRLGDFLWRTDPSLGDLFDPKLALFVVMGPFLLGAVGVFLGLQVFRSKTLAETPRSVLRARAFVLIWFLVILGAVTCLAPIPYFFRIRYGILTMVPSSLLLAWVFGLFANSELSSSRILSTAFLILIGIQISINVMRSVHFRRGIGMMMVAVDRVYHYVDHNFPGSELVLLPDFRPYDYRSNSARGILSPHWLAKEEDLSTWQTGKNVLVISWKGPTVPQLRTIQYFSGCSGNGLFDQLISCPWPFSEELGAYLMRLEQVTSSRKN